MKAKFAAVFFLVLTTLTFNQVANAGVLVEPYVGYLYGSTVRGAANANYSGAAYGARLGYSMLGFAIGGEYAGGSFTDDSKSKNSMSLGDVGVFMAYKFPVLIRGYVTYVPSSKITDTQNGSVFYLQKGTVVKVGLGYTGFPTISINLEYVSGSYTELSNSTGTSTLSPAYTTSAAVLTISVPVNIL